MKTFKEFMAEAPVFGAMVKASSYGPGLYGGLTTSGKPLTPDTPGVANKTLPIGSQVTIKDPKTGKSVTAPVIDRGPYVGDRQYDLTAATTRQLGYPDYKKFGVRTLDITPNKIPDLGVKVNMNIPKIVPTVKR